MGMWETAVNAEIIDQIEEMVKTDFESINDDDMDDQIRRQYYYDIGIQLTEILFEYNGNDYQL